MARTNQGGSVLSFVIIGVVMVALLVGGVYIVKQQMTPEAMPTPAPQKPEEKKQPQTPQKQDKQTPQKEDNDRQSSESHDSSPVDNSSELPQTGPSELFVTLIALGVLSATAVSYMRSRRPGLSL